MSDPPAKSRRPEDTPFMQQKLKSWQPILTHELVIILFLVVGIIFVPVGTELRRLSDDIYEDKIIYDDKGGGLCGITSHNDGRTCTVTFTLKEDVPDDLMVYYELNNFYQNHRRYVGSRDAEQLRGNQVPDSTLKLSCDPLYKNGSVTLNPCGLIANSFFNDVITVTSSQTMSEKDISWASDRKKKFGQPDEFYKYPKTGSCQAGEKEAVHPSDGTVYCYSYPEEEDYQYLYETYPQISPLLGVEDEHFIVWMRTAGLPNFRKLYGKIENQQLSKGDQITFSIEANFDVSDFDGTKAIVISTVGNFGGKNPYLGVAYIVVGSISLFFGCLFLAKHLIAPRKYGELSKLHWI